ncbi:MAG: Synechococcus phage syn9 [Bacteroidota bacterium]|jgi:uncharacterized protein (TIGR02466 family)
MSTPKLIDVTPFEPMIIKVHYNGFDWKKLKPVCESMIDGANKNSEVENENGKSSVYNRNNQPHNNPAFKEFYNWLKVITDHIIYNEWNCLPFFKYKADMSWVNVHKNGGLTLEHEHGAALMVAATYLDIPNGSGYIEYKDPTEYVKGFLPRDSNEHNWKEVKAETGDTLLFPGWIRHRTQPNNLSKDRWVLTTNFIGNAK